MTYFYPNFGQLLIFLAKSGLKQNFSLHGGYGYILNPFYLETRVGKKTGDFFCNVIR